MGGGIVVRDGYAEVSERSLFQRSARKWRYPPRRYRQPSGSVGLNAVLLSAHCTGVEAVYRIPGSQPHGRGGWGGAPGF